MPSIRVVAAVGLALALVVPTGAARGADAVSLVVTSARAFSPNGDGKSDVLTATVTPAQAVRTVVEVNDFDGNRVATLFDGAAQANQAIGVRWDGADAPDAPYTIVATAGSAKASAAVARWSTRPVLSAPSRTVVVLDPGHGGASTAGAVGTLMDGTQVHEGTVNLDLALRTRAMLVAAGLSVVMTRTGDNDVALGERTRIANAAGADVFVSIHNNYTEPGNGGTGSFYCGTGCIGPATSKQLADALLRAHLSRFVPFESATWRPELRYGTSAMDDYVMWTTIRGCPSTNTILGCHYGVLGPYWSGVRPNAILAPATLMESLALSQLYELELLMRADVRNAIAASYADGIASFIANRPVAVRLALAAAVPYLRRGLTSTLSARITNTGKGAIPVGSTVVVGDRSRVAGTDASYALGTTIATARTTAAIAPGYSGVVKVAVRPTIAYSRTWKVDLIVNGTRVTRLRQPGLQLPVYVR